MCNTSGMKIGKTFDKLSEISSDNFFWKVGLMCHKEIVEISMRGEFHDGVGDFGLGFSRGGESFGFGVEDLDDVVMEESGEAMFVEEVLVRFVVDIGEDFHSVVRFVFRGVGEIDGEVGFVEFFDNLEIFEVEESGFVFGVDGGGFGRGGFGRGFVAGTEHGGMEFRMIYSFD